MAPTFQRNGDEYGVVLEVTPETPAAECEIINRNKVTFAMRYLTLTYRWDAVTRRWTFKSATAVGPRTDGGDFTARRVWQRKDTRRSRPGEHLPVWLLNLVREHRPYLRKE